MATKNKKADKKFLTVEKAIDTVELVNTMALTTTEKVFTKSFKVIEKWQKTTDKFVKKGLNFSAKQQDNMFDTLDTSKEKTVKTLKKFTNRFNTRSA